MTGAKLEVLLVNAQGIKQTNVIGRPVYYVIVQLGTQECISKVSKGKDHNVSWNEKIIFEFPLFRWRKLTYIKFRIMAKQLFRVDSFVGETTIHLGGIITEGTDRGFLDVKPTPYNVVLDDDTYEGEIKIGFKFMANNVLQKQLRVVDEDELKQTPKGYGHNLWGFRWVMFLMSCFRKTSKLLSKEN